MQISNIRECFYQPGEPGIIDTIHPNTGRGLYSGETLEQIQARHPGAEVGDFDAVCAVQDDYWRRGPVEITAQQFEDALNVLPPVGWERGESAEVFKMSERTSGAVTAIYCRLGDRYFTMQDAIYMAPGLVIARCEAARQAIDSAA